MAPGLDIVTEKAPSGFSRTFGSKKILKKPTTDPAPQPTLQPAEQLPQQPNLLQTMATNQDHPWSIQAPAALPFPPLNYPIAMPKTTMELALWCNTFLGQMVALNEANTAELISNRVIVKDLSELMRNMKQNLTTVEALKNEFSDKFVAARAETDNLRIQLKHEQVRVDRCHERIADLMDQFNVEVKDNVCDEAKLRELDAFENPNQLTEQQHKDIWEEPERWEEDNNDRLGYEDSSTEIRKELYHGYQNARVEDNKQVQPAEINTFESEYKQAALEASTLKTANDNITKERDTLQSAVEVKENELVSKNAELKEAEATINGLIKEKEDIQSTADNLTQELTSAKTELEEKKRDIKKFEDILNQIHRIGGWHAPGNCTAEGYCTQI